VKRLAWALAKNLPVVAMLAAMLLAPNPKRSEMVTCPQCSTPNDPDRGSNYCRVCGARL
jgi:hypothetical protein